MVDKIRYLTNTCAAIAADTVTSAPLPIAPTAATAPPTVTETLEQSDDEAEL
jgi:hypothetical protein